MTKKRNYIFDFDSTLTRVEALDVLAEITLKNNQGKNIIESKTGNIKNIRKLNESDVIMSSDEFLQKSFEDTDKYSNRKYYKHAN